MHCMLSCCQLRQLLSCRAMSQSPPSPGYAQNGPGSTSPRPRITSQFSRKGNGTLMHPRTRAGMNKNVEWINSTGAWAFYIALIFAGWAVTCLFVDAGMAWTYVHLVHGVASYFLLHWFKGSPIDMDQGKYDKLTFWEQLDDGVQNTANRKFFTAVPIVLFILAIHGSDFRRQPLGLNLAVVIVLTVAKMAGMHKVRIFGINA